VSVLAMRLHFNRRPCGQILQAFTNGEKDDHRNIIKSNKHTGLRSNTDLIIKSLKKHHKKQIHPDVMFFVLFAFDGQHTSVTMTLYFVFVFSSDSFPLTIVLQSLN